jgi:hypothetical protein
VGRGSALGALDRGWEVAAAMSTASRSCGRGPVRWRARERKWHEMQTRESKSECIGSFRMCSGSRRRIGRAGAGAGMPMGCVASRAAATRVLGRHVAQGEAARERPVLGTGPVKAAGVGRRENRGGGSWR